MQQPTDRNGDSMKNVVQQLRAVGGDDKTVNVFLICLIVFMFVVGLGAFIVCGFLTMQGQTPPNWITGLLTSAFTAAIVLVTAQHQTTQINGTASTTASKTASSMSQSQAPALELNQQTIQALLSFVEQQMSGQSGMQANTAATEQNTAAVLASTVDPAAPTLKVPAVPSVPNLSDLQTRKTPVFNPHETKG